MAPPYQISTLLYVFDDDDRVLLLHRSQEPNLGLWSPCGGKLHTSEGESPYACACREAQEELRWELAPHQLHLTGLVSEKGCHGQSNWLMFLFEVKPRLNNLPPPHREGRFAFFSLRDLDALDIPETDRTHIWPLFWRHRGGFFSAHCQLRSERSADWLLEESRPAQTRKECLDA